MYTHRHAALHTHTHTYISRIESSCIHACTHVSLRAHASFRFESCLDSCAGKYDMAEGGTDLAEAAKTTASVDITINDHVIEEFASMVVCICGWAQKRFRRKNCLLSIYSGSQSCQTWVRHHGACRNHSVASFTKASPGHAISCHCVQTHVTI